MNRSQKRLLLLIAATAIPAAGDAPRVTTRLVCNAGHLEEGKSFVLGVLFEPEPGWHLYWRNPGDSGMPARIDWDLPPGWRASEILWPYPSVFRDGTLVSFGYDDEVLYADGRVGALLDAFESEVLAVVQRAISTFIIRRSGFTVASGARTGAVTLSGTIAQLDNLLTGAGTGTITYLNSSDTPSASATSVIPPITRTRFLPTTKLPAMKGNRPRIRVSWVMADPIESLILRSP